MTMSNSFLKAVFKVFFKTIIVKNSLKKTSYNYYTKFSYINDYLHIILRCHLFIIFFF